jgi:hypothetical protein
MNTVLGANPLKFLWPLLINFCNKLERWLPGKPFLPSLMFVGKARANPSTAPFRRSTQGQASGLTHKHQTWLERLAREQRSSLIQKIR